MKNIKKILIAEDDAAIVDALIMILEEEGYEVETSCGRDTLEKVYTLLPNLIFLDIWMPGISGQEICKRLKHQEQTKHIPIVILSASKDIAMIAKKIGATDFLTKPFELEDVLLLAEKYT